MTLVAHPIANEFPEFEREDFEALKADIQANGQQVPIELYKGQILDGRNRYRACMELGIEPQLRAYDGPDPLGHAISLNVIRRQLSTVDKAMFALMIKPRLEKAAAERKAATHMTEGHAFKGNRHTGSLVVTAPVRQPENQQVTTKRAPTSAESAAKIVGVSGRTVENVAYIQKHKPELIPEIKAGIITIPLAVDKINAEDAIKRKDEAVRRRQAEKAARTPEQEAEDDAREAAEQAKKKAEADAAAEWERLNRLLDVMYNLKLLDPTDTARLVPQSTKNRVVKLLTDTEVWCRNVANILTEDLS